MKRLLGPLTLSLVAWTVLAVACGSRTGLVADVVREGSTSDITFPDGTSDGPLVEGGPLDVTTDCPDPPTCDPNDLGFVYKCGVRVYQCSSLEQCFQGSCKNPCLDTLGQDTSNGCEFYSVETDVTSEAEGVCFAMFIVNQWSTGETAKIQVDRAGTVLPIAQFARIPKGTGTSITYAAYDETKGLAKDEIAILFLSRDPNALNDSNPFAPRKLASCPAGVTPAVVGDAALHGTGKAKAFHVKTNVPVVAYQILPYGGGRARVTGSTLLLPINVWGKNYVAVNAYKAPSTFGGAGPTLSIVASESSTTVKIKPVVNITGGGGLSATAKGVTGTYTLNAGEYLQFTQNAELTGSPIEADKPIAVFGGSTLMNIPSNVIRADSAHSMLPPISALGHEYVAVRYRSRDKALEEYSPWKFVGIVNGTTLSYEPAQFGAPTTLSAGQQVEYSANAPFVVKSQDASHPFSLSAHMTGGDSFAEKGTGDPEFVNVVAPDQYLRRYTFFTDPTYPETNLVVIRVKDDTLKEFPDVNLDCAGKLTGWTAVGTSGKYEFTRIDLSSGNFVANGSCNNGVHSITGTLSSTTATPFFGVTVWGWGNTVTYTGTDESDPKFTRWVSYGYPVGVNNKELNTVKMSAQ